MQQGDCNAPATFQCIMVHIFRDHLGKFVHVYLDDIFVYSMSWREHQEHLKIVFTILRDQVFYLSKAKVDAYSKRMDCLGHIIDDTGIHAETDKLERIRNWRKPRNYKDVIAFLGLVQYLAHFMANVAAYTGPLSAICADNASFQWRPLHQKCFDMIKALASKSPILKPIDPNCNDPIWVICDASTSGVGAVYGQGPEWKTCRPAGFMSKKLTNAQHAYATYEHETLAILEALLKWEDKLVGRRFIIVTDHRTLEFFKTQKDMSYRQRRWVEYLDRFEATIQYVKGETNLVADALSRYYANDRNGEQHAKHEYVNADARLDRENDHLPQARVEEITRISAIREDTPLPEAAEARHEEAQALAPPEDIDPGMSDQAQPSAPTDLGNDDDPAAFDAIAAKPLPPQVEGEAGFGNACRSAYKADSLFKKIIKNPSEHKGFNLGKDKLLRTINRAGNDVVCIPRGKLGDRSLCGIVIASAHQILGHFGPQKTADYIRRYYWWPRMVDDIDSFCRSCHKCQTSKNDNKQPAGLLHSLPIPTRPWGSIAIDFLGPFPKSKSFDYLMVVIDRMTSMVHLIPCTTQTKASEIAYLFLKEIVRLHGLPDSIVSDRDTKFTSRFWRELHRLMGTRLLMSTSFHPQTDGVTERANRSVAQILRTLINDNQLDWINNLPLAEFAINCCQSSTTGFAPFELNYGFMPKSLTQFGVANTAPGIRTFALAARDNLVRAHDAIIAARVRQAHHANKHRSEHTRYKEGDLVYLSTENLSLPKHRTRKLMPKYVGPFKVIKEHGDTSNYRLELPDVLLDRRVHPNFHASLLRPHVANDDAIFPGREPSEWYDFGAENSAERIVDEIVSHARTGQRVADVAFFVRWATGDSTWEPWKHVKNLAATERYFELQGVTRWQDLPKQHAHAAPLPDTTAHQQRGRENVPSVGNEERGKEPEEPAPKKKIYWRVSRDGIKTRESNA
jgi:hypothetical protein